jgi:hypothetical protein
LQEVAYLSRIWFPILAILLFIIGLSTGVPEGRVVPASDVLAKIKAGQPADFDDYTIVGDLDLSTLKTKGLVHFNHTLFRNSVECRSTTFSDVAYFHNSNFNKTANFMNSKFNGTAHFEDSNFNGTADFRNSTFNGPAYFQSSRFVERASFFQSFFRDPANFLYSTFNGSVDIRRSTFNRLACFEGSRFNGSIDFWGSTFNDFATFANSTFINKANFGGSIFSDVYFSGSSFNNTTSFLSSTFNHPANFEDSKFNGYADFRNSIFNGKVDFWSSRFNGYADFFNSTFNDEAFFFDSKISAIDFSDSQFNKIAAFDGAQFNGTANFYNSQFKDDALFEDTKFRDVLYLERTKYNKLYIRWDNIKSLSYDESAYQQLIENFRKLGYSSDVDNSYYQFRKDQFLHRRLTDDLLVYFSDLIAWRSYGFSKKPFFPLAWSAFFIVLFGGIWMAMGSKKSRSKIDEYSQIQKWPGSTLEALFFSATLFLSGTKLFVDPPDIPELQGVSRSIVNKVFITERLLGALFSILFFLAITGMIIKST